MLDELSKYPDDESCVIDKKFVSLLSALSAINQTRVHKRLTGLSDFSIFDNKKKLFWNLKIIQNLQETPDKIYDGFLIGFKIYLRRGFRRRLLSFFIST